MDEQPKRGGRYDSLWWATAFVAVFVALFFARMDWLMNLLNPDPDKDTTPERYLAYLFLGICVLGLAIGWWRAISIKQAARNRARPLDMGQGGRP